MKGNSNEFKYYICNKSSSVNMKKDVYISVNIKKIRFFPYRVNAKLIYKGSGFDGILGFLFAWTSCEKKRSKKQRRKGKI